MSRGTSIEWTDDSWNPVRARLKSNKAKVGWHCVHKSEGCRNCYAESFNLRLGTQLAYKPGHERDVEIFLDEKMLLAPLKWRKPRKIFVCSMTDLFADFVSDEVIEKLFVIMALAPQHVFQVLTKRPERMRSFLANRGASLWAAIDTFIDDWANCLYGNVRLRVIGDDPLLAALQGQGAAWGGEQPWPLRNVWLGVSVEDQAAADERLPILLDTPAAVRWLSCEPLLGPVDVLWALKLKPGLWGRAEMASEFLRRGHYSPGLEKLCPLDWIVAGGESGPSARPMHPDWARSLRDQCASAGVPFLFKQWGAWASIGRLQDDAGDTDETIAAETAMMDGMRELRDGSLWIDPKRLQLIDRGAFNWANEEAQPPSSASVVKRVGKAKAGRLLDGVQHDGYPS